MTIKQFVLVALVASTASGAIAQSSPRRPTEDLVPIILISQAMADELKQVCTKKYPDLEKKIEREHQAWVLYPIKIAVLVNGNEYTSPSVTSMREVVRYETQKKDDQRMRTDCENFPQFLDQARDGLSSDALAPFLK